MLRLCLKSNHDRDKWKREVKRYNAENKRNRKLLLVGLNESGKSTVIKQLQYLFENGRDDIEPKTKPPFQNYIPTTAVFETKFSLNYQGDAINSYVRSWTPVSTVPVLRRFGTQSRFLLSLDFEPGFCVRYSSFYH